jgi:RNA polymerase sigma factor (TIGR02999 family)
MMSSTVADTDDEPARADDAPTPDGGGTPELFSRVYGELRGLAESRMRREKPGQTLQATALVHEVYVRLMRDESATWDNPRHFFAAAAESMRRILIERARRYAATKHGGGRKRVDLDAADVAGADDAPLAMLALDEALTELRNTDARLADVVMLRYFAGLSVEETAAALEMSARTVKREWSVARAWLAHKLGDNLE